MFDAACWNLRGSSPALGNSGRVRLADFIKETARCLRCCFGMVYSSVSAALAVDDIREEYALPPSDVAHIWWLITKGFLAPSDVRTMLGRHQQESLVDTYGTDTNAWPTLLATMRPEQPKPAATIAASAPAAPSQAQASHRGWGAVPPSGAAPAKAVEVAQGLLPKLQGAQKAPSAGEGPDVVVLDWGLHPLKLRHHLRQNHEHARHRLQTESNSVTSGLSCASNLSWAQDETAAKQPSQHGRHRYPRRTCQRRARGMSTIPRDLQANAPPAQTAENEIPAKAVVVRKTSQTSHQLMCVVRRVFQLVWQRLETGTAIRCEPVRNEPRVCQLSQGVCKQTLYLRIHNKMEHPQQL